jgi:hypothetical protein
MGFVGSSAAKRTEIKDGIGSTPEVSLTVRKITRPRSENWSTLDCHMGGRIASPNC